MPLKDEDIRIRAGLQRMGSVAFSFFYSRKYVLGLEIREPRPHLSSQVLGLALVQLLFCCDSISNLGAPSHYGLSPLQLYF